MTRVYVMGRYTADNVIDVLANIRKGITASVEVAQAGFAVFCPWLDHHLAFHADLPLEWYRANSMEWLRCSDVCLLLPGWENSVGVREELKVASELGIPVMDTVDDLVRWEQGQPRESYVCVQCGHRWTVDWGVCPDCKSAQFSVVEKRHALAL